MIPVLGNLCLGDSEMICVFGTNAVTVLRLRAGNLE